MRMLEIRALEFVLKLNIPNVKNDRTDGFGHAITFFISKILISIEKNCTYFQNRQVNVLKTCHCDHFGPVVTRRDWR